MSGSAAGVSVDDPSSGDDCGLKPAPVLGPPAGAGSTLDEPFFPETIAFRWGQASPDERRPGAEPVPQMFGGYVILGEIARGGMGVVFKARHVKLNRIVALKMILAGKLASHADVERFSTEAQAAAQLEHSGIVPIYEVGEIGDQRYFSMGFVEGESLSAKIAAGPLAAREAATLLVAVAEAVDYAHSKGIIHRDLKPGNVLVGKDGQPRVTDFGLCKRTSGASELTGTGQVLGTPSYMPPEQAAGKIEEIGPLSDVYSLGAILYTLLTGRPPFQTPNAVETLLQVLTREPVPPRQLNANIPPDLETICLKCLEKESHRRYLSAQEFAADLRRFLKGEPTLARPIGAPARGWRWCRRNPVIASLMAGVAAALIAGTLVSSYFAILARQRADLAEKYSDEMRKQRNFAKDAETRRTEQLRDAYFSQAQAHRWSGRSERRFKGLAALTKAAEIQPSTELRNEAIAGLALADIRSKKQWALTPPSPGGMNVAFDNRYERYARYDAAGRIQVFRIADGAEQFELPGEGMRVEWVFRFSPDDRLLAARYEQPGKTVCHIWDLEERAVRFSIPFAVNLGTLNFSADSRAMAVGEQNGTIHVFDVETGQEMRNFSSVSSPYSIAFHPGKNQIAVSSHLSPQVYVHDLDSNQAPRLLPHPAGVRGIMWNPDGRFLATACADARVYVWNVGANGPPAVLTGHTHTVTTVVFNRQGNLLASYGWDGITRLWDPFLGRQLVSTPGEMVQSGQFSPDDTQLGFSLSPREVGIWEVAPGVECRSLGRGATRPPYSLAAAFSADGQFLATASDDGVRIWDLCNNREIGLSSEPGFFTVGFHPQTGYLFATGWSGFSSWPIATESEGAARIATVGPRQNSGGFSGLQRSSLSRDANTLAIAGPDALLALEVDPSGTIARQLLDGPHPGAASAAVSPDGKWGASGTWKGTGVKIWDVNARKLLRDLPIAESAHVQFSPGGDLLVTATGAEYRIWNVATWEPVNVIPRDRTGDVPGPICFSPDGKLLALRLNLNNGFALFDAATYERLADFEAGPQSPLCFGPHGAELAVQGDEGLIQIWNLRDVRTRLREMILDLAIPAFPPPRATHAVGNLVLKSN